MSTYESESVRRIDVSADKPGRWVSVDIAQGATWSPESQALRTAPDEPWRLTLGVENDNLMASDPWTWLEPDEARAVAAALIEAADEADKRRTIEAR